MAMARITVVGGGVVGLCAAMMLAREGHDVTVLERDPAVPTDPEAAWAGWERRGVNQFRMLHFFASRFRSVMDENLPDVIAALEDAGALRLNPLKAMPVEMSGGFRPTDTKHDAVTARRPIAEAAIARAADATENLEVRRGVAVAGLLTGAPARDGVPHVIGVRTEDGEDILSELVVDVGGRRSALPAWLDAIGARQPIEEKDDCGFIYYGRHFRSGDGSTPPIFGPLLAPYGSVSILTLPADNGTWGVGFVTSSRDGVMRRTKDVDVWTRTIKSFPLAAHWLDGEPIDDGIAIMAKIEDRHRTFLVDGAPVATGVLALADSWACTNPSVGRGISIGAIHAVALRDLLRDAPADPVELAQAWHDATMATAEPWYRSTLDFDRSRIAEIDGLTGGAEFVAGETYEITQALQNAATKDPDVLRAFFEIVGVQSLPEEIFARPGMFERVVELGQNWRDEPLPAPSREELVSIVHG
jgi:flavin-dependent dehydrogenase